MFSSFLVMQILSYVLSTALQLLLVEFWAHVLTHLQVFGRGIASYADWHREGRVFFHAQRSTRLVVLGRWHWKRFNSWALFVVLLVLHLRLSFQAGSPNNSTQRNCPYHDGELSIDHVRMTDWRGTHRSFSATASYDSSSLQMCDTVEVSESMHIHTSSLVESKLTARNSMPMLIWCGLENGRKACWHYWAFVLRWPELREAMDLSTISFSFVMYRSFFILAFVHGLVDGLSLPMQSHNRLLYKSTTEQSIDDVPTVIMWCRCISFS